MERAPIPTPRSVAQSPCSHWPPSGGRRWAGSAEPSTASSAAWPRRVPPCGSCMTRPCALAGRSLDEKAADLDSECTWLLRTTFFRPTWSASREVAEAALRPWTPVFMHGDLEVADVFVEGDEIDGVLTVRGRPRRWMYDLASLTLGHPEHLEDVVTGYGGDVDLDVVRGGGRCAA